MTGLASSFKLCSKRHAYFWLQDASPVNCENRLLGITVPLGITEASLIARSAAKRQ